MDKKLTENEYEMYFEFHSIDDMLQFLGLCKQLIGQYGKVKISVVMNDYMVDEDNYDNAQEELDG